MPLKHVAVLSALVVAVGLCALVTLTVMLASPTIRPVAIAVSSLEDCHQLAALPRVRPARYLPIRLSLNGQSPVDFSVGLIDVRLAGQAVESAFMSSKPLDTATLYSILTLLSSHPGADSRLLESTKRLASGALRPCDIGGYQLLGTIQTSYSVRISMRCVDKASGTVVVNLDFEQ